MSSSTLGILAFFLLAILVLAHVLGQFFVRLRQPRVIGEILAGILVGPSVLGHFWRLPLDSASKSGLPLPLDLCYWLGLLLLMFLSGCETQQLFHREERKQVAWLAVCGTGIPFVAAIAVCWKLLPASVLQPFMGASQSRMALVLVMGIAVAVTSIPVISRIFFDLNILHTRFARLVLGVAVVEDIALWAVLAIATALAHNAAAAANSGGLRMEIAREIAATLICFLFGLALMPRLLRRFQESRWNLLGRSSPSAYLLGLVLAYVAAAALLKVNLVFAAFLAGFAVPRQCSPRFADALGSISTLSFSVFIPIYFALVGYKIDLGSSFSPTMIGGFLLAACAVKMVSVLAGARFAGFGGLSALNLAVATNARGGPGIVLASVALEAGIISATFYTTLIVVAIVTSQAAGAWLEAMLRRGRPLLEEEPGLPQRVTVDVPAAA